MIIEHIVLLYLQNGGGLGLQGLRLAGQQQVVLHYIIMLSIVLIQCFQITSNSVLLVQSLAKVIFLCGN